MSEITGNEGGKLLIELIEKIIGMIYPKRCVLCDRVLSVEEKFLCTACSDKPPYIGESYCLKCGRPIAEEEEYCPDCYVKKDKTTCGRAAFVYDNQIKASISRFKYHGRQEYADFYAEAIYEHYQDWIQEIAPDALIPVPIHKERYRKRGYNQAELVANCLSKRCGVPVVSDYLIRIKNTLPQKELSDKERFVNLCQAFSVRSVSRELYKNMKCVIIIDDIYTTGSTMEACTQILKKYGVEKIYFLCVSLGQGV